MNEEFGKVLVSEQVRIKEYVQQNWRDPVATQYILWIDQTIESIKHLEQRREILTLKKEKIELLCRTINEDGDSIEPKVLQLTRKR